MMHRRYDYCRNLGHASLPPIAGNAQFVLTLKRKIKTGFSGFVLLVSAFCPMRLSYSYVPLFRWELFLFFVNFSSFR